MSMFIQRDKNHGYHQIAAFLFDQGNFSYQTNVPRTNKTKKKRKVDIFTEILLGVLISTSLVSLLVGSC